MKVRSRHNSKNKRRVQVILLSIFVIGLGYLTPSIISGISTTITYPFHVISIWLDESSSLVPSFIRDRRSLIEENENLQNQLVVAGGSNLTRQRLIEENNRLRQLLGIKDETRIAAAVIARPDELPYDLLQIDRGANHGIEVGSPVFIGRDIVIGLVVHAAADYSFVELITSPGFEATTFISGPNVVVPMEGIGGGVARVKVPQGIPLAVGNLVYLPSVEPGVYGRVSYVENEPTQPEQYGYISPEVAISGLFRVSVGSLSQISQSVEEIDERILEHIRSQLLEQVVIDDDLGTTSTSTGIRIIEAE